MIVTRVLEPGVGRSFAMVVDPPLNENWSDLKKLEWHAAVVECDHKLPEGTIKVYFFPTNFCVSIQTPKRSSSTTANTFHDAWTLINGIDKGLTLIEDVRLI